MAARSTSGAVHLTSLDLDISGIQQNIQAIESEMAELEKSILSNANNIQDALSKINPELSTSGNRDFENSMKVNRASVEDLNLAYKEFLTTLSESKVSKDILGDLPEEAKKSADEVSKLTEEVQSSGTVTKEAAEQYETLSSTLKEQKGALADATTEFNNLPPVIEKATSAAEKFVNRLLDLGKNEVIYAFTSGMRQAFSEVIPTITETENAVIELQRVLNDAPERSALSDELYDIAYTYGQTFDVVQETAVKFAQTGLSWTEVIDATRATMLGLNTAELEVSSATQGLISVLTQFNMSASELETVIDKVNITADNFPITSEKIVSALQRAGGTASSFGMTLEQTIGVITALGAATGRTGQAIGTALNSLISFSMKATSLSTFEDFLGLSSGSLQGQNVVAIWKALADEIKNTGDSGAELAKTLSTSEEFMNLFNEDVAEALGLAEEFQNAEKELNSQLAAGQDIYSTVGTYRQNYFIALLNNIDMAVEAMEGMNDAAGYSAQENETAMEALSKKYQQLVVSLQELAVALGEAGFLDFLKTIADISTAIVKLIGDTNMLVPVIELVVTAFLAIKAQNIADTIGNVAASFENGVVFIKNSVAALMGYTTATEGAATATTSLSAALGGVVGIIGLVTTAVTFGIQAYKNYKQAQKEALEEAIELGQEATDSFMDLAEAYNKYKKALAYGDTEGAAAAQETLLEQLGYTIEDVGILEARYGDLDTALQTLIEDEYKLARIKAESRLEAAQDTSTMDTSAFENYVATDIDTSMWAAMRKDFETATTSGFEFLAMYQEIPRNAEEVNTRLSDVSAALEFLEGTFTEGELASSGFYEVLLLQKAAMEAWLIALGQAEADVNKFNGGLEGTSKSTAENAQIIADLRTETDKFGHSVLDAADASEDLDDITLDDLIDAMAKGAITAEQFNDALQNLEVTSSDLFSELEKLQNGVKTAEELMAKINSQQGLTLAEYQQWTELPSVILDAMEVTSDGLLRFTDEGRAGIASLAEELAVSGGAMVLTSEQLAVALQSIGYSAEDAERLAAEYGDATDKAEPKVYDLAGTTDSLSDAESKATTEGNKAAKAVADFGAKAAAQKGKVNDLTTSVTRLATALAQLRTAASNALSEVGSGVAHMGTMIATQGKVDASAPSTDVVTLQDTGGAFTVVQPSVNASTDELWNIYFGSNTTTSNRGTSSTHSSKGSATSAISDTTDALDEMKDTLEEILAIYEHTITAMKRQGATADEIVAIYRQGQKEIHELANKYRARGVEETSEYIRDLQEKWWEYQDTIEEIYDDIYDRQVKTYENALSVLEGLYEFYEDRNNYDALSGNLDKQMAYYQKLMAGAHEQAERLRAERAGLIYSGAAESSEVIQNIDNEIKGLQKNYLDWQQNYFDLMEKKATNALQPFEDFISMADSLNLWDYLDFTKVDYLRQELTEINKLLDEGMISQAKYNELLKSMTISIYNAQKDLMKKEKESLEDYYDSVVDGLKAEIEAWQQRKQEVEDYYDSLISDLKSVEKENDRINQQVEYYNSRQKIITNLEQARARSGVAWREKEMEYQQQLVNLDADWNKTQKDWDIEDQIAKLEELKATAVADIDATIEKINKSISETEKQAEEAIARIDDELDILAQSMAVSIQKGMKDGLINAEAEYDKALTDAHNGLLDAIDGFKSALGDGMTEAAGIADNNLYEYLIVPMQNRISDITEYLRSSVNKSSNDAANNAMKNFRNSLIIPLRSELSSLASLAQRINTLTTAARTIPKSVSGVGSTNNIAGMGATVNITNYNSSTDEAAFKTQSTIQKLLG